MTSPSPRRDKCRRRGPVGTNDLKRAIATKHRWFASGGYDDRAGGIRRNKEV
jgi:hypothetical protein